MVMDSGRPTHAVLGVFPMKQTMMIATVLALAAAPATETVAELAKTDEHVYVYASCPHVRSFDTCTLIRLPPECVAPTGTTPNEQNIEACKRQVTIPPVKGGGTIAGKIAEYECGDNCYLTIVDKVGHKHSALCAARECRPWNDAGRMPKQYIGKRAVVTISRGIQFDGNNDVVGYYPAFASIGFVAGR
jgi:hypothetical protein